MIRKNHVPATFVCVRMIEQHNGIAKVFAYEKGDSTALTTIAIGVRTVSAGDLHVPREFETLGPEIEICFVDGNKCGEFVL